MGKRGISGCNQVSPALQHPAFILTHTYKVVVEQWGTGRGTRLLSVTAQRHLEEQTLGKDAYTKSWSNKVLVLMHKSSTHIASISILIWPKLKEKGN